MFIHRYVSCLYISTCEHVRVRYESTGNVSENACLGTCVIVCGRVCVL